MRRKKYLWRLSAGLAALLFGPLSLFAQEAGEEQPSPTWEKFIEGLKKLIPGNLEDDFLDTIKEDSGILIEILIAIPVVFLVTYLLTRVLKWLVF
ncbi:MAG: hypothetical protein KDD06_22760, partial [Phaeodactylibacter sp.]|nr:hypothetical protein [Phaeodactylibacter sp.]